MEDEFDCEPIYNKKYLKTKMTPYGENATDFRDEEIPKVGVIILV